MRTLEHARYGETSGTYGSLVRELALDYVQFTFGGGCLHEAQARGGADAISLLDTIDSRDHGSGSRRSLEWVVIEPSRRAL
jgi:hypothetical protein